MSQNTSDPWVDHVFEQQVREVAYHLWERDGKPEGQEQHYWFRAIEKCMARKAEDDRISRGLIDPM